MSLKIMSSSFFCCSVSLFFLLLLFPLSTPPLFASPLFENPHFTNKEKDPVVWEALKRQVAQLKSEKNLKHALTLLKNFQKKFPHSSLLPFVKMEMADIWTLPPLNQIEHAYQILSPSFSPFPPKDPWKSPHPALLKKIQSFQERYGEKITKKRLNRLLFSLENHFARFIAFPKSLSILIEETSSLEEHDLKDGYGHPFHYKRKQHASFEGENFFAFDLLSKGADGRLHTADDLMPSPHTIEKIIEITLQKTYQKQGLWKADVVILDPQKKIPSQKTVQKGDKLLNYLVFGVKTEGIVLLKNHKLYAIRNES